MPCVEHGLFCCRRRRTPADDVPHSGFVDRVPLNRAHFNERTLRFGVIVRNQLRTGQVQLFRPVFQDIRQFRDKLGQFDGLADFILSDTEELRNQCAGIIPLARIAKGLLTPTITPPLAKIAKGIMPDSW